MHALIELDLLVAVHLKMTGHLVQRGAAIWQRLLLKDQLGTAKHLLAVGEMKMLIWLMLNRAFVLSFALSTWQGTAGQDGPPGSPGEQVIFWRESNTRNLKVIS